MHPQNEDSQHTLLIDVQIKAQTGVVVFHFIQIPMAAEQRGESGFLFTTQWLTVISEENRLQFGQLATTLENVAVIVRSQVWSSTVFC